MYRPSLIWRAGVLWSRSFQLKRSPPRCTTSRQVTTVQATWDFKNRQTLVLIKLCAFLGKGKWGIINDYKSSVWDDENFW